MASFNDSWDIKNLNGLQSIDIPVNYYYDFSQYLAITQNHEPCHDIICLEALVFLIPKVGWTSHPLIQSAQKVSKETDPVANEIGVHTQLKAGVSMVLLTQYLFSASVSQLADL